MKYDIFISYSRKDFEEVYSFIEFIKSRINNIACWFDLDGIESGEQFTRHIINGINNSDFLLFFVSSNSLISHWTQKEVMYSRNKSKKIIPIILRNAEIDDWFLFEFGTIDCIDITDTEQVNKLIINLSSWTNKPIAETEFKSLPIKSLSLDSKSAFSGSCDNGLNLKDLTNKGDNYFFGMNGVTRNYSEAVRYYNIAAQQGYPPAQCQLGFCYQNGYGVELDMVAAVKWYSAAAEQNYARGLNLLAICYKTGGKGVDINESLAFKLFDQSARLGSPFGQRYLGECFEYGIGVEKDIDKAISLYRKAVDNGWYYADADLKRLGVN